MSEVAGRQRYECSYSTLSVDITDPESAVFRIDESCDSAEANLDRESAQRLYAQLGAWLRASPAQRRAWLEASGRPCPQEGRTWLYRSPVDGAEVLVRFHDGEWQDADPELFPTRWYRNTADLLSWPGRFTELEKGFPR